MEAGGNRRYGLEASKNRLLWLVLVLFWYLNTTVPVTRAPHAEALKRGSMGAANSNGLKVQPVLNPFRMDVQPDRFISTPTVLLLAPGAPI
jgi:hypothetical protein